MHCFHKTFHFYCFDVNDIFIFIFFQNKNNMFHLIQTTKLVITIIPMLIYVWQIRMLLAVLLLCIIFFFHHLLLLFRFCIYVIGQLSSDREISMLFTYSKQKKKFYSNVIINWKSLSHLPTLNRESVDKQQSVK